MGFKKKAKEQGGKIICRENPFKVLGQIGRYSFKVYETERKAGWFGHLTGNHYFQTTHYKEFVLYLGACNTSFRITADIYNFTSKQSSFKLSYKTIESQVWTEGRNINMGIKEAVKKVDTDSIPKNLEIKYEDQKTVDHHIIELTKDLRKELKESIQNQDNNIEKKEETIYIEIDDICCKEQKKDRSQQLKIQEEKEFKEKIKAARKKGKKAYKESKYLFQTVALLSKGENNFRILAKNQADISDKLKAFITSVGCISDNWVFIVDGHRPLQSYIKKENKGRKIIMILDWYHLQKKTRAQLMMGMKRTEKREDVFYEILEYLWYGLIEDAKKSIKKIPNTEVKNQKALDILIGYIERQKELIPNYALRKRMGMKNSSGGVEKENDRLIAHRQKKNGMSWSKKGSNALGVLQMLKLNKQFESFHEAGVFYFKWVA